MFLTAFGIGINEVQNELILAVDVSVDCIETLQECVNDIYDFILEPYEVMQVSRSDETQELVEDLRWKHYPFYTMADMDIVWEQQYPYVWFEDGALYVATEDDVWFIEMKRKED